ncbi:flavocytochrome c [Sedimentibacter sp.]|uniref:flavocytochrome c n=1 Tax=Sedimentibacter sp. TaxID=1960295 RepID=UPI00289CA7CE|nr:flavocytochrome c [Sedimentibacter sp.]
MFRKVIALLLCVLMLFSLGACDKGTDAPANDKPSTGALFKPGTYEGTAEGFNGNITVAVTVSENKVESIEFKEHKESIGVSDPAFNTLPDRIIEKQTVAIDTISGCTVSSKGILEAVKAALLAAGATEADITKAPAPDEERTQQALNYEADVVIIGAGGAGMSAAYEALQAGGTVVILEKTGSIGGNTIAAGSAMNAADPERQKNMTMNDSEMEKIQELLELEPVDDYMSAWQKSVKSDLDAYIASGSTYLYDSPDLHKLQTYVGGDYVGNPVLIDKYAEGAAESVKLLEELGTVWKDDLTAAIGATWNRSHMPTGDVWGPKGASFVLPQAAKVEEMGGEVKLNHKVEHIISEEGKVVGVKGVTSDGDTFEARAKKGVIIATGGFGANVEMRQKYNEFWPNLDESVKTTNVSSATGDGITMALEADANLVGMEWIQMLTNADKQDFSAAINNIVYVNAEGKRYVKEDGRRDEIASATLDQTGSYCYWITDTQEADERLGGVTYAGFVINDLIDGKLMYKADTIEELAEQLNIDPATLQATLDKYNAAVDKGVDEEFGRKVFGNKIEKGPYYANYVTPKVHHTMGGIEINEKAQVINSSGQVIEGLYAAGEVAGGIHGANRLGGNAISDIVTFGRIAGTEVMK